MLSPELQGYEQQSSRNKIGKITLRVQLLYYHSYVVTESTVCTFLDILDLAIVGLHLGETLT